MKIVFTGVCKEELVKSLYNEIKPEAVSCIGRLIQVPNPLNDVSTYYYEIMGAREASKNFEDNSLDLVWVGNTDDNVVIFEKSSWMPKLKSGGRLIVQHIYRTGEPIEINDSINHYPDNWYLLKA